MAAYERYRGQDTDDHEPLYERYDADERQYPLQHFQYGEHPRPEHARLPIPPPAPYTPSHITTIEPYTKGPHAKIKRGKSIFGVTGFLLFLVLFSTLLFIFTTWFVQAAFSGETAMRASQALSKIVKADIGDALAVLRIAQGVLTTCTTLALMNAFELMQWALASRDSGVGFASFLGLSPTTALWGVITIIASRVSGFSERIWGLARVLIVTSIWVAGVVLFVRASVTTAYDTAYTYDVTAGIGQFNASLVPSYLDYLQSINGDLYNYTVLPSTNIVNSYSLITNSMHTIHANPLTCTACDSYLLPGGVISTTPWIPESYDSHPLVNIANAPALQLQFERGMDAQDGFTDEDCSTYGKPGFLIGIKMCLAPSTKFPGSLIAGLYVCSNGTADGACSTPDPMPNITATLAVYSLTASTVSARSNFSILSATSLSIPVQNTNIDIAAYRTSLDWLLDFNATNIPPPSSIAEHFWNGAAQLSSAYWAAELTRTFQSILAFPLWHFTANNYGNIALKDREMVTDLPREFYTKASLTRPYTKIVLDRGMFIAFVALEGVSLLFIWGVLVWLWVVNPELPQLSSYPLVDFAFKAKEQGHEGGGFGYGDGMVGADDKRIRRKVRDVRVTLRGAGGGGGGFI